MVERNPMQTGYKDAHNTVTANEKISQPYTCYWVENEVQKKGLNLTKKELKLVWNVSRLLSLTHGGRPLWVRGWGGGG